MNFYKNPLGNQDEEEEEEELEEEEESDEDDSEDDNNDADKSRNQSSRVVKEVMRLQVLTFPRTIQVVTGCALFSRFHRKRG